MPRPRFSLRGLLLLTVAVAVVCWYRDLPRQNANRFARLIEAGEYEAAEAMFYSVFLDLGNSVDAATVRLSGQSRSQWLHGLYPISIETHKSQRHYSVLIDATACGVDAGNISATVTASPR